MGPKGPNVIRDSASGTDVLNSRRDGQLEESATSATSVVQMHRRHTTGSGGAGYQAEAQLLPGSVEGILHGEVGLNEAGYQI